MRTNRLLSRLIAVTWVVVSAGPGQADVLRALRFESGDLRECKALFPDRPDFAFSKDRNAIVAVVPNPSGEGYVLKSSITPKVERAEIRAGRDPVGSERWYGWSLYLPPDYIPVEGKSDILFQWHRGGNAPRWAKGHPMTFMLNSAGKYQMTYTYQTDPKNPQTRINKSQPFDFGYAQDRGKWIHWALHAKWSPREDGYLAMYRNGKPIWERRGANWLNAAAGPMVKAGIYTGNPGWKGNNPTVVYHDNIIVGDETSSVREASPGAFAGPSRR